MINILFLLYMFLPAEGGKLIRRCLIPSATRSHSYATAQDKKCKQVRQIDKFLQERLSSGKQSRADIRESSVDIVSKCSHPRDGCKTN
jgi:hypothetical protein